MQWVRKSWLITRLIQSKYLVIAAIGVILALTQGIWEVWMILALAMLGAKGPGQPIVNRKRKETK